MPWCPYNNYVIIMYLFVFTGQPEYLVIDLLTKRCCKRSSTTCFKNLSISDIELVRSGFYNLSTETAQNQFVIDYLSHHSDCSKSVESVLFTIAGKSVCQQCWRLAYGIKYTRFKGIIEKFKQGIVQIEHGLLGKNFSWSCD